MSRKPIEDEFRTPPPLWGFKSETMAELLARPEPKLEWLIESMWTEKSRGLIAGNPGVGKTWLALEMLLSVSTGLRCLNKYGVKPGAVLLVEEESSIDNLARRIQCMARGRGLDETDLVSFHHVTRQFLKIPKHEKELIAFIKHHQIKLVVFDSLRRFHGADENSSEKMQPVLDSFARINIEAQTSVILIHHLSKQPAEKSLRKSVFERMRGTSDLWAWRDCIIGMEGEIEGTYAACSFQFRDAESPAPISIKRASDEATGATTLELLNIEETEDFVDRSEAILTYIRAHQPVSRDQTITKCKGRKQSNGRIFDVLAERNLLVKHGYKWVVPEYAGTNGNERNE